MTTADSNDSITRIVDQYIAMWNETDPVRRRELIGRTLTPDARYLDPLIRGDGHDGIDAMMAGVQEQLPGFRFRRTSDVDMHNDRLRFTWELGPEGGQAFSSGVDFGVLEGGRIASITGFIDYMRNASGQELRC